MPPLVAPLKSFSLTPRRLSRHPRAFYVSAVGPLGLPRNPRQMRPNTNSAQAVATTSVVIPDSVWDPGRTFQKPQRFGSIDIHAWIPAYAGMTAVLHCNCVFQRRNLQSYLMPPLVASLQTPAPPPIGARHQCLHKRLCFGVVQFSLQARGV